MAFNAYHRDIDEESILFNDIRISNEMNRKAMLQAVIRLKSKEDLKTIMPMIWPDTFPAEPEVSL